MVGVAMQVLASVKRIAVQQGRQTESKDKYNTKGGS